MKRVVVTGMGIVSSIGNSAQEVLASLREAKSGIVQGRQICRARLPLPGARRAEARLGGHGRPQALRFHGRAALPGTISPWSRPSAIRASRRTTSPTSAPGSSWARAAPRPGPSSRPPIPRARRAPRRSARSRCRRPCARPTRRRWPRLQDQGRQLFDLLGLRHLGALHRQRRRADPMGQAGHGVCRRLRGARLDAVRPVRRHGRHVDRLQRPPPRSPAAPMTRTATAS